MKTETRDVAIEYDEGGPYDGIWTVRHLPQQVLLSFKKKAQKRYRKDEDAQARELLRLIVLYRITEWTLENGKEYSQSDLESLIDYKLEFLNDLLERADAALEKQFDEEWGN